VLEEIRMLARHGYGVLAFDLFGNGESSGHSNGLGDNAQPAVDAALDWLAGRPEVDPDRVGALGSSLGGEVPRIAPRPVLLIASGGDPEEIPVNRRYREAAGRTAELYEIPDAAHTAGITAHPREYEARVVDFLDRAL
jgi:pimeloyl-ACP methyl ester carboxylesterase